MSNNFVTRIACHQQQRPFHLPNPTMCNHKVHESYRWAMYLSDGIPKKEFTKCLKLKDL